MNDIHFLPALAATRAVRSAWMPAHADATTNRNETRARHPILAAALDALTAGMQEPKLVALEWGAIDSDDPDTAWLFATWPELTDALDDLIASTLFDPEGFRP